MNKGKIKAALVTIVVFGLIGGVPLILSYTVHNENKYNTTIGTITANSIERKKVSDGDDGTVTVYYPKVSYEYTVDSRKYSGTGNLSYDEDIDIVRENIEKYYKVGDTIDIMYKKNNAKVSLTKGAFKSGNTGLRFWGILFLIVGVIVFFMTVFGKEKPQEEST